MISNSHRFHGLGSLNFAYRKGSVARGQWFSLRYIANNRRTSYRAAVVVSKKIHKSAVVRNRIRRRIYEIVRSFETDMVEPYDLVITIYSEQVAEADHTELAELLRSTFKQAHVLK